MGESSPAWRALGWRRLVALLLALGLPVSVGLAAPAPAATVGDLFGPDVTIRAPDGWYEAPIHGTLLPDGRVLMWGKAWQTWPATATTPSRFAAWIVTPTPVGETAPAEITPPTVTEPVALSGVTVNGMTIGDDLFCGGNSLTTDGQVVATGGTRWIRSSTTGEYINALGVPYETIFNPITNIWSRVPGLMVGIGTSGNSGRWYPTDTRLPDGRILVTSGWGDIKGKKANLSSEIFDPVTQQSVIATPSGKLPVQVLDQDYTHAWVLPYPNLSYDLLEMGMMGVPVRGSTKNPSSFLTNGPARPNPDGSTGWPSVDRSSTMLELRATNGDWGYTNGSILVAGGNDTSSLATHADVYDPIVGAWKPTVELGTRRSNGATVVLPDGRALILTGHDPSMGSGVLQAQYVDPANGFSVTNGTSSMPDQRGYHTVALLLPDGRVLVAGGRDSETWASYEKPTLQYYSPDYLTKPRPKIVQAPAQVGYKQGFLVVTSGATPKEVVLVAPGSMTHSFDENQRVIQLPLSSVVSANGFNGAAVTSPPDGWTAPPGNYMLFVLDQNRVPSVAQMIHLG